MYHYDTVSVQKRTLFSSLISYYYPSCLIFGSFFVHLQSIYLYPLNMNKQDIYEAYQSIAGLLKQRRLKEAHLQLHALLATCADYPLQSRLEQAETAYGYMLQYMRQGSEDPSRHGLYLQLCAETWEIADQVCLLLLDGVDTGYYHSLRRTHKQVKSLRTMEECLHTLEAFDDEMALCQLMPNDRKMLDSTLARHESANKDLFLNTWANSCWTTGEAQEADAYLHSEQLPSNDLCLFVSAVTLSLLACFDSRKVKWMMDTCQTANAYAAQRALVGLALTLHRYSVRLSLYPALTAQLALMDEDGKLGKSMNRIYIQLLRSQDTENINRKMQEEILPEMMKNVEFMRNMKFGFEESSEDNDWNPDWEKTFEESGLNDKIREMNDLQMEGSDVYMSTFSQLKKYPFFNEISNWFYPFDRKHSTIVQTFGKETNVNNPMLDLLLQSGFLCNSDKYSMAFTLNQIPQVQRNLMFNQMTSQNLEDLLESERMEGLKQYAARPEVISNQYIHDLYRFFKLNPRCKEMHDIFQDTIALHLVGPLASILGKPELLREVADFHFKKEHYAEAAKLYGQIAATGQADADIYQKSGYCLQKEKRYVEAINAYLKADMLKPDHVWTIRHLATCYRQSHDFEHAIEYYRKAESIQPDNRNILFHIGSCMAELNRYEEALQYFFRLDLMDNDNIKTWRAIAWCSFVCGKDEQAAKYYNKILVCSAPLATDYLNAGHVAWKRGNISQAASLYAQAAQKCDNRNDFFNLFAKDKDILIRMGIHAEDISLMIDLSE